MLPEPLLCHILSFLTTEEAVWTSVLSSRWRYLWKWVPRLELDSSDFQNDKACADFINKFLNFQNESYLREFKLSIDQDTYDRDHSLYQPCLGRLIKRKIQHFQVENKLPHWSFGNKIPLTLSASEALVSLKLHFVKLNDFVSLSLPCLKIINLEDVRFPNDAAVGTLISCSPVLEDLNICLSRFDVVVVLRVFSQSLKSFTLKRTDPVYNSNGKHSVVIDTPRLEYLSLMEYQFKSFKIISMSDSVKVNLDVKFELMHDDLTDRNIIYNLLANFSGVKDMAISWKTLKKLVNDYPASLITRLSTVLSHCLVSSLESVEIKSPVTEKTTELKLVRYFLKNSATLKKLVLRLDQFSGEKHKPYVLKQLLKSPRRSSLCQFEVFPAITLNTTKEILRESDHRDPSTMMIHLPEKTIHAGKLSPIFIHLRPRNMKRRRISPALKKKKTTRTSSSIKEISKGSFEASVKKPPAAVTISSWDKSEILGKGAYGSVYLATNKTDKDKKQRAIKTAELSRASSLMDEGRILLRLQSPFVVGCFGDEIASDDEQDNKQQYNLVLEYCSCKSIGDLMEDSNHGGYLWESDVKIFARDILSGLSYIHDQGIIHCDIKPDNLLLIPVDRRLRPNGYWTKIGDFGLAMEKGSIEYGNGSGHKRGTTRYMAPELITSGIVDYGVDVWALGCTVLEMLTGQIVWGEHYSHLCFDEDWVDLIGNSDFIPYIPDWLSEDAQDFLTRCLDRDIQTRWSSQSLKNHPFVMF